jgi:ParB family chromosome partitioning protein
LGRPIKAIVRQLTDEELIVAQGKENLERRDLSFIERALFAVRLEDHGFGRSALLAALSVHKGNLSTMISVARAVPEELIIAIGSAPRIGRPRWEQLSELLVGSDEVWRKTIATPGFETLDSDVRFTRVLNAMTHRPKKAIARVVKDGEGRALARVEQGKGRVNVTINEKLTGAFGAFLVDQIPQIYLAFRRQSDVSTV